MLSQWTSDVLERSYIHQRRIIPLEICNLRVFPQTGHNTTSDNVYCQSRTKLGTNGFYTQCLQSSFYDRAAFIIATHDSGATVQKENSELLLFMIYS